MNEFDKLSKQSQEIIEKFRVNFWKDIKNYFPKGNGQFEIWARGKAENTLGCTVLTWLWQNKCDKEEVVCVFVYLKSKNFFLTSV